MYQCVYCIIFRMSALFYGTSLFCLKINTCINFEIYITKAITDIGCMFTQWPGIRTSCGTFNSIRHFEVFQQSTKLNMNLILSEKISYGNRTTQNSSYPYKIVKLETIMEFKFKYSQCVHTSVLSGH